MHNFISYWLAAVHLPEIGPRKISRWLNYFASIETLFLASSDEWRAAGISADDMQHLKNPDWASVEKELAWAAQQSHHHLICFDDVRYPPLLKEIVDPPLVLYVQGQPDVLMTKQLAIVGARNATPIGISNAEEFAFQLARAGLTITSGLALGIDGASHRGALAANGQTIGVMGTGLKHVYPPAHCRLVEQIIQDDSGAIISELPLNIPPKGMNFPRRNRIIAGLSLGVLVVEAALKSGSLITARYALEQNREVFAMPGSIHHPLARGCHHLIRQGTAKLIEKAADILEEIQMPVLSYSSSLTPVITASKPLLLDQIGYEPTPLDVIILRSGLTMKEVSSILLTLELDGYIESVAGGYIRTVTHL